MRIVIAQRSLAGLGGSETFVLTLAEHFARLGHEVVVHAQQVGLATALATERAIAVVRSETQLPDVVDATLALDRTMAIDLARRYPAAARLYVMHNTEQIWLPPPEPGIVAATLAPNDRLALLARGCAGAGEVVRVRQPIDLSRFSPRGWASAQPSKILLLGNYSEMPGQRVDQLKQAWSQEGFEWHRLGIPEPTLAVAEEVAKHDIVVGYGRSILEAMACGRPAYVHEHSGSDGWVTIDSYDRLESDGFAGTGLRRTPDIAQLRQDLLRYDPSLGRIGQDLARKYHDARMVAATIIALIRRLGSPANRHDPEALNGLRNLAESHFRADRLAEVYRMQLKMKADIAAQYENSTSWKLTKPLRWAKRLAILLRTGVKTGKQTSVE